MISIAIDGTESAQGRALTAISALAFVGPWAEQVAFRIVDVADENVDLAVEALRWDMQIAVETCALDPAGRSPLEGVHLYAGICFSTSSHMRLKEAKALGVPVLLATQFPAPGPLSPSQVLAQQAGFDPRRFAARMGQIVLPWLQPDRQILPPLTQY